MGTYHPFGGVKSYTLGNNQTVTRSYDQDGRIASYTLGATQFNLAYDPASRITAILDTANAVNSNSYGYDNLDRLIQTVLPNTTYSYGYDLTGNRIAKGTGANSDAYSRIKRNQRGTARIFFRAGQGLQRYL